MTATIENIRQFSFSSTDRIFFDANIWLMIHGPFQESTERVQAYSKAYQELITKNLRIYIDLIVISEFINRYARYYYETWCAQNSGITFKQYRELVEFKNTAEQISDAVDLLLIDCSLISINHEKTDLDVLMNSFRTGNHDFNDLLIADTCQKCDLILVSDDGDFIDTNLHVLTYNRRLLDN